MKLTSRNLGWLACLCWLATLMALDHLASIQGMITRHHAHEFNLWLSTVDAVLAPAAAACVTWFWWRARKLRPSTGNE